MRYTNLHLMDTCDIMGVNIVVTDMDKTLRLIEEKSWKIGAGNTSAWQTSTPL